MQILNIFAFALVLTAILCGLVLLPYLLCSKDEKRGIDEYFAEGGRLLDGNPWE